MNIPKNVKFGIENNVYHIEKVITDKDVYIKIKFYNITAIKFISNREAELRLKSSDIRLPLEDNLAVVVYVVIDNAYRDDCERCTEENEFFEYELCTEGEISHKIKTVIDEFHYGITFI